MRVPCSRENISGRDFDEQSGENWAAARAQNGHEGGEQSGENWVTARAQNVREGEEQSLVGQAVYRTYSFFLQFYRTTGHTVFMRESAARMVSSG